MSGTAPQPPAASPRTKEWQIVALLCAVAAVRVFFFSSVFPVFSNIDEQRHFDLVVKYSHGQLPHGLETVSPEAAGYIALYGSPEFVSLPENLPGGKIPPPYWSLPIADVKPAVVAKIIAWQQYPNSETTQPPLYYILAGLWMNIGHRSGFENGRLIYWIRFLDILLAAALIWVGYAAARTAFPQITEIHLGVPLLLACFPQDAFYSIENDALSPLCFGWLLCCIFRLLRAEAVNERLGMATGLAFAATYLTKISNLPLLVVVAGAVLAKIWQAVRLGRGLTLLRPLALAGLCAAIPVGAWTFWCLQHFGDFTGSHEKMKLFSWTTKPFAAWWQHPLFTPRGLWTFGSESLASFWRGEFWWHGTVLASPAMDLFFTVSSVLLPAVALISVAVKSGLDQSERGALTICGGSSLAIFLFFAWLSISLDFGTGFYPSQEYPYFTSGRLLSGIMIPFAILYVYGLYRATAQTGCRWLFSASLAGICIMTTLSEIIVNRPAYSSAYNWFHM